MIRRSTTWHVTHEDTLAYVTGSLPETDCWSLEKHVESCSPCGGRVSDALSGAAVRDVARVRAAVLTVARAEARPRPVRTALRGWTVRTGWAAGPALRLPWLLALALVAGLAVVMAHLGEIVAARPLLLALAPVMPLAGAALSYGRYADPLHEIAASTPSGGLRLLLIRTAVVLGVSMPLLTLTGVLLPAAPGAPGAATWLLPGLALTLAALTLGSYVGCRGAAAGVGTAWLAGVALAAHAGIVAGTGGGTSAGAFMAALAETLADVLSGPAVQGGWAVAAVLCAGLLALRRTSFDRLESM